MTIVYVQRRGSVCTLCECVELWVEKLELKNCGGIVHGEALGAATSVAWTGWTMYLGVGVLVRYVLDVPDMSCWWFWSFVEMSRHDKNWKWGKEVLSFPWLFRLCHPYRHVEGFVILVFKIVRVQLFVMSRLSSFWSMTQSSCGAMPLKHAPLQYISLLLSLCQWLCN